MKLLVFFQSFAAVFAITDPLGAAPIFLGLTMEMTRKQQLRSAIRASLWSFGILAVSGLCGNIFLKIFAISLPAFQAAGGLVIVLMGLEMLGGSHTRVQHEEPPVDKDDPIIVPFAMPLVAGPGAITTVYHAYRSASRLGRTSAHVIFGCRSNDCSICNLDLFIVAGQKNEFTGNQDLPTLCRIDPACHRCRTVALGNSGVHVRAKIKLS